MMNRIEYSLNGLIIPEPNGWLEDEKELIRSNVNEGIIKKLSDNLQFHGVAYDFLADEYSRNGIKSNVKLQRRVRNDQTDIWEIDYIGWLDFSTYKQSETYISVKINENKFLKNIESRFKEKFELDRTTDLFGNNIGELQYENLELEGREIFRESLLNTDRRIKYQAFTPTAFSVPLENLVYKSDPNVNATAISIDSLGNINYGQSTVFEFEDYLFNPSQFFYTESQNTNNATFKIKGKFLYKQTGSVITGIQNLFYRIIRTGPLTYDINSATFDFLFDSFILSESDGVVSRDFEVSFNLNKRINECFAIIINRTFQGSPFEFWCENLEITIEENEPSQTTNCKVVTVNNALKRLFRIVTGMDHYFSEIMTGFWGNLLLTNGALIRKIPDAKITISLEDLLGGLNVIDDIIFAIENEIVRVERIDYIYQNQSIDIGKLANIERSIIENLHYSEIEIGYDFNGEYEEVMGLDEYNIKNRYTTCIDVIENQSKNVSKVFADAYGITLAQLKPNVDFPKEDTKYDKNNYFIDAKEGYFVRKWQDDFDNEPTGIFSPNTAFNLRLSPFNCLLRKGRSLSIGLQKYPNELISYSSTEGNSELVTVYPERANEPNSILGQSLIQPEQINGVCEMSLSLFHEISQNKYKMIRFVNEFNQFEFGYIKSIKLDGNTANIQLLKK